MNAVGRLSAGVLEGEGVLLDPLQALFDVGNDLLRPNDEDDSAGTCGVWPSWLPPIEAANSDPFSVTAWTLPSITSGAEVRRRISSA